jgi:hypothetical protein
MHPWLGVATATEHFRQGRLCPVDPPSPVDELASFPVGHEPRAGAQMVPLYGARVEDLGPGDFPKVDCAACEHTAVFAPGFLYRLGLKPRTKVLDLKDHVRCRGCGARAGCRVIKWAKSAACPDRDVTLVQKECKRKERLCRARASRVR